MFAVLNRNAAAKAMLDSKEISYVGIGFAACDRETPWLYFK
jgi:hypothetical protein